jgi:hypothetical protein
MTIIQDDEDMGGSSTRRQYDGSNVEHYGGRIGAYPFLEGLNVQDRNEDYSEG